MQWQSSQLALWLQLLKQHFQDLLYKSVSHSDVECEISLEESPFWSSFSDAVNLQIPCTQHLQRQVIFLFFKLCFMLIHISGENSQQCSCAEEPSLLNYKLPVCSDHCCHIGLLEISEWLQRCGHIEMFDRVYLLKSSTSFALSFLQLYMEEVCFNKACVFLYFFLVAVATETALPKDLFVLQMLSFASYH